MSRCEFPRQSVIIKLTAHHRSPAVSASQNGDYNVVRFDQKQCVVNFHFKTYYDRQKCPSMNHDVDLDMCDLITLFEILISKKLDCVVNS